MWCWRKKAATCLEPCCSGANATGGPHVLWKIEEGSLLILGPASHLVALPRRPFPSSPLSPTPCAADAVWLRQRRSCLKLFCCRNCRRMAAPQAARMRVSTKDGADAGAGSSSHSSVFTFVHDGVAVGGYRLQGGELGASLVWEWKYIHKCLGVGRQHWRLLEVDYAPETFRRFGAEKHEHVGRWTSISSSALVSTLGMLVLLAHTMSAKQTKPGAKLAAYTLLMKVLGHKMEGCVCVCGLGVGGRAVVVVV